VSNTKTTHYAYVDALRGYAILAVIVVHVASALPPTASSAMRLFEQGARGVQLFYVASALTLLMSWHSRDDGYAAFMVRRIFRIVPMFWLAIPLYLLFSGMGPGFFAPPPGWSVSSILRTAFFVDALFPSKGTVVPGGWTVTTEMAFYTLFPVLVFLIRSWRAAIVAYLVSTVVALASYPIFLAFVQRAVPDQSSSLVAVWVTLSLPVQFPVFLSGFVAYFSLQETRELPTMNRQLLSSLLILSISIILVLPYVQTVVPLHIAYSIPFVVLVFCLGRGVGGPLINGPIIALGKVSFSAYLCHFAVLNVIYIGKDKGIDPFGIGLAPSYLRFTICLIAVTFITYLISYLTYRFIEKPLIKVGHQVAENWLPSHKQPKVTLG
jgi:peptidoglycan/LPS O-acetylase OafA/YrhL